MSRKLLLSLMAAALLCSALPAWGQELPDGKGKEMVAAQCNSCHAFYARLGWTTLESTQLFGLPAAIMVRELGD